MKYSELVAGIRFELRRQKITLREFERRLGVGRFTSNNWFTIGRIPSRHLDAIADILSADFQYWIEGVD